VEEVSDAFVPAGEVVAQDPPAGSNVRRGRSIHLLVSSGPAIRTVPDLIGKTRRYAQVELTQAGLRIGETVVVAVPATAEGEVVACRPRAGSSPGRDSRVDLLVSGRPTLLSYVMPDLRGLHRSEAAAQLRRIGVSVAFFEEDERIWRQDPEPGEAVRTGSVVYLD
jgi:serine/threonine-protein kinase